MIANGLDDALPLFRGARPQELLQIPLAVGAEVEAGVFVRQIHRLVEDSSVNRSHLRLVIRIADIKVYVGDQVQGPLLPGLQGFSES